jgi:hypothetical protein
VPRAPTRARPSPGHRARATVDARAIPVDPLVKAESMVPAMTIVSRASRRYREGLRASTTSPTRALRASSPR